MTRSMVAGQYSFAMLLFFSLAIMDDVTILHSRPAERRPSNKYIALSQYTSYTHNDGDGGW
jgi:hypothetical protein